MDDTLTETDLVISGLPVQPKGVHAVITLPGAGIEPFHLYKNPTYTLLLRVHSLGFADGFEIVLMHEENIILAQDVFLEDAAKPGIRDIIREFNTKNVPGWSQPLTHA